MSQPTRPPLFSCLCPTYRRPNLLANAIACFTRQTLVNQAELLILDDAGQIAPQKGFCSSHWQIMSVARRFGSLPGKYDALAEMARGEILVVWEDDDIFLPWHLEAIAQAMAGGAWWAHPRVVGSLYTGTFQHEPAAGRFHSALALRRDAWEAIGGWPRTRRLDFDQELLGRLMRAYGPPADSCDPARGPSYVFRWGSTGAYHGQAFGVETWWDDVADLPLDRHAVENLLPRFDVETARLLQEIDTRASASTPPVPPRESSVPPTSGSRPGEAQRKAA